MTKIVNICFRRAVRLYGNFFAPQSLCMDDKEHNRRWDVMINMESRLIILWAIGDNPILAGSIPGMAKRRWMITLDDVDSFMLEEEDVAVTTVAKDEDKPADKEYKLDGEVVFEVPAEVLKDVPHVKDPLPVVHGTFEMPKEPEVVPEPLLAAVKTPPKPAGKKK